jgi:hypothetical protein
MAQHTSPSERMEFPRSSRASVPAHFKEKIMSQKQNSGIAQKLLAGKAKERTGPDSIAALFSDDVSSRSQATTACCPGSDGKQDAARLPTSFVVRAA